MIAERVLRSMVDSMGATVAAEGGHLEFVEMSGGDAIVRYCQPPDCGDACSMPATVLQRMLQAMVEAQGGRGVKVVVKDS